MRFFTKLLMVSTITLFYASNLYSQSIYTYKILFKQDVSRQIEEAKTYLQKLFNSNILSYSIDDNSLIVSTSKAIDKNILSGKLDKLRTPAKLIELVETPVEDSAQKLNTTSSNQQEILNKAEKSKQLQKERQPSSQPYRRY